jgi:hypothetical protein
MPESEPSLPPGQLNPEDLKKVFDWVISRWGPTRACPYHPETPTHWQIGDIVQTLPYAGGNVVLGGRIYPLVTIICMTCGNTVFLNAVVAGLVPGQLAPDVSENPQPESPVMAPDSTAAEPGTDV